MPTPKLKIYIMPLNYICGDLFETIEELPGERVKIKNETILIPHIVNNKGGWGAGFVIPLGNYFPKAKEDYNKWSPKLGWVLPSVINNVHVLHMCAQTLGGKRPLYYNALSTCMDKVCRYANTLKKKPIILCPAFGSGLAGGDWNFIEQLIYDCWIRQNDYDVIVHYLKGSLDVIENKI
jgi:hypothetical protein